MPKNHKVCVTCRGIFDAREYMEECDACIQEEMRVYDLIENAIEVHGHKSVKAIANFTKLPEKIVKRVLRSSRVLSHEVSLGEVCKRCEKRASVARLQYCAICLLHIQAELYQTVEDISAKNKKRFVRPTARLQRMNARESIAEKRKRTGSHRFNPAPRPVKGGGR